MPSPKPFTTRDEWFSRPWPVVTEELLVANRILAKLVNHHWMLCPRCNSLEYYMNARVMYHLCYECGYLSGS